MDTGLHESAQVAGVCVLFEPDDFLFGGRVRGVAQREGVEVGGLAVGAQCGGVLGRGDAVLDRGFLVAGLIGVKG